MARLANRLHGLERLAEKMQSQDDNAELLLDTGHPQHKIAAMDLDEFYETFPGDLPPERSPVVP